MAELHQHIGEIFHRCYSDRNMICEEKVIEHMLAFIFSGEMVVYNSSKKLSSELEKLLLFVKTI